MKAHRESTRRMRARRRTCAALGVVTAVLVAGTLCRPYFWLTADQRGDLLLRQRRCARAAEVYADPWRIGVARYRNGDFEAAAGIFARVAGAEGAFNQGNAWLMHGRYAKAIDSYDRALGLRPGWKEALENRALAAERLEKIEAAGKDREQEQTGSDTPDQVVFDRKGKDKEKKPIDLNGEPISDEAMRAAWLRRVQTCPGDFLRAKFAWQASAPVLPGSAGGVETK